MPKPKRYYVPYLDQMKIARAVEAKRRIEDLDPAEIEDEEEFDTLDEAREFQAAFLSRWGVEAGGIWERCNIVDDTPAELRAVGATWIHASWDDEPIEDQEARP